MKYLLKCCCVLLVLTNCQEVKRPNPDLNSTPVSAEVFGEGWISTDLYERDLAISPAGNEMVYTLGDYRQSRRCLVVIRQVEGQWIEPRVLPFSGTYQDIEPFFADEGNRLYFASNRPIFGDSNRNDYNIWYVDRMGEGWSEPIALDSAINTPGQEFYPSVSQYGNVFFTASREDGIGREDIFVAMRKGGILLPPVVLDSTINTPYFEFNAYIHPNEKLLVFSSFGREDDLGGGDLYYSLKDPTGKWLPAMHLGSEINSPKLDYCPFIDVDRNNFYFTSEKTPHSSEPILSVENLRKSAHEIQNGLGDIYRIGLKELPFYKEIQAE